MKQNEHFILGTTVFLVLISDSNNSDIIIETRIKSVSYTSNTIDFENGFILVISQLKNNINKHIIEENKMPNLGRSTVNDSVDYYFCFTSLKKAEYAQKNVVLPHIIEKIKNRLQKKQDEYMKEVTNLEKAENFLNTLQPKSKVSV